jgi:hypothetical protein
MIFPIYFAHGYRPREVPFNEYFGILFENMGFTPSIDPPSGDVNAAKLEKHLKYNNGLIAVLSKRDDFLVSPYIMFEIQMCLKLGKPSLVFIEDNLPDNIVLPSILQRRFSTKSFSREVFEHMNSLSIFKRYIGDSPIPKYQIYSKQKSCLLVGFDGLLQDIKIAVCNQVIAKGYRVLIQDVKSGLPLNNNMHFELLNLDLAIVVCDNLGALDNYIFGAINSYQIPTILLTTDSSNKINSDLPVEFRPRIVSNKKIEDDLSIIYSQIDLSEEDFVTLKNKKKVHAYVNALASSYSAKGQYTNETRSQIISKIHIGDNFSNISNSTIANRSKIDNSFNERKKDDEKK